MYFDIASTYFLLMATCLMVSLMMALAWSQNTHIKAYLWWSGGFLLGAGGLWLIALKASLPEILSVGVGTVVLLFGLGLCWAGARSFDNRPINAWPVALGVLAWSVVYMIPEVQASPPLRAMVMSILIAGYSFAIAMEFWNGRTDSLVSRMPLATLCIVNGVMQLGRAVLSMFNIVGMDAGSADFWFAMSVFQPALIMVAGGLYGIGIGRDRMEQQLRDAADIDVLTNALNRGAVLHRAEQMLDEARANADSVALVLFDLDRFKSINDSLGHHAGDEVLKVFAATAAECLRPADLFGRIGGEEFVALMPGSSGTAAQMVAEQVRQRFEQCTIWYQDTPITATVSAGVIAFTGEALDLDRMMSQADRALYDAKGAGRNRVRNALVIRGQVIEAPLARTA